VSYADHAAEQAWQDHCDAEFQAQLDAANERIKRLEEAGDRMASILKSTRQHWYSTDQCEVVAFDWNEAKEAKL